MIETIKIPRFSADYQEGKFTNTMTGEVFETLDVVVLDYREDRVLWAAYTGETTTPVCVNGSKYSNCIGCQYAKWGEDNTAPLCAEEISVLLYDKENILGVLTARRSQVKYIDQYLGMKVMTGDPVQSMGATGV